MNNVIEAITEFFDNLMYKLKRIFTKRGIRISNYLVSYRIIPILLVALLILILIFSAIGRALSGRSSKTPASETSTETSTETETATEQEATTEEEATQEEQQEETQAGSETADANSLWEVKLDNKRVALYSTEKEAKALLDGIKAEFVDVNDRSAMVSLVPEMTIGKIDKSGVPTSDLTKDTKALIKELLYGSSDAGTYVTTDEDTMWGIATEHGMSLEDLIAMNPEVDPDNIYGGIVLKISNARGAVSVRSEYEEEVEEDIPYDTIYEDTAELYSGEEEVVTWGRRGTRVVTRRTVKINGVVESEEITKEEILEDAVTEVILRGIADREDAGTDTEDYSDEDYSDEEDTGEGTEG